MFDSVTLESSRERAAVLALMASRPLPLNQLGGAIEEIGSALALLDEFDRRASDRLFEVDDKKASLDELEDRIHAWSAEGIEVVTVLDSVYPDNLRMVYDLPPALFIRGTLVPDDQRSVAVVGTRSATADGIARATDLARSLIASGYTVVSGLAAGIDTAAHVATLDAGGRTVAVIGTGLREIFPKENAALQDHLGRESAVVSQFWPGQGARQWTFPARNAVMSGFARATAVVEASHTSGARMQARLALEHGRPAFLMRPLLEHGWARQFATRPGAYVVDTAEEIVGHLERLYSDELVWST
jgi:DNA processing protein